MPLCSLTYLRQAPVSHPGGFMTQGLKGIVVSIGLAGGGASGQVFPILTAVTAPYQQAVSLYKQGVDLHTAGQVTASEEVLQRAYRVGCALDCTAMPAGAIANELGLVYDELGQNENAEFYYLKAIHIIQSRAPTRAFAAINNLAVFYIDTSQYGKAERLDLAKIASQAAAGKQGTRAKATLASLALVRGRYEESDALFQQAFVEYDSGGDNPIGAVAMLSNLGSLSLLNNRPEQGLDWLQRAVAYCHQHGVASDPDRIKPLIGMGVAEARTGHRDQAERDLKAAVNLVECLPGTANMNNARMLDLCYLGLKEAGQKSEAKRVQKKVSSIHRELGWAPSSAADVTDMLLNSAHPRK